MTHRAVVIGAGKAGQAHAQALAQIGVEHAGPISGLASVSDRAWLVDPATDVVHVATANDLHVPLVAAALRAGKHVVCEKPLALDVAGAEELARLARTSGMQTTVCLNYRFLPLIAELAARVAAGELGEPHLARGSFLQDWLLLASDENWRIDAARGGASRAVADIGVHWLDLVEVVAARHVEAVVAQLGYLHGRGTEDHAGILVRFAGGLHGACVLSQASAGHANEVELSLDGTSGSATWRSERRDELWLGKRDAPPTVITKASGLRSAGARALAAIPAVANEGRRNLIGAFYARLDGREPAVPLPTFDDGLRHARFAAATMTSARTGAWVALADVRAKIHA